MSLGLVSKIMVMSQHLTAMPVWSGMMAVQGQFI